MAVIDVLPSDGKVIDEGPVGCSVGVCCDDFRHLDIGLPPEILRLKDAGYLTQAVAACDRLWSRTLSLRWLLVFVLSGIACSRRRFISRCRVIGPLR